MRAAALGLLLGMFVFGHGGAALAQQAGGFTVDVPDVDNFVTIGVAGLPDYIGSDDYTVGIGPAGLVKPWGNDRYIRLVATELGVNILNQCNWSFGPVFNYRFPRDDVEDSAVDDFDDVDAALEAGAFVGYSWISDEDPRHRLSVSLQGLQDVSGTHEGFLATASARYFVPVAGR